MKAQERERERVHEREGGRESMNKRERESSRGVCKEGRKGRREEREKRT